MEYFVQRVKHKADGSVEEPAFSHVEDGQRQIPHSPVAPQPGDGLEVAHAKPLLFDDLYKKPPSKPLLFDDLYKKPPSKPLMFNDLYRPWSRKDHRGRDDASHHPLQKHAWIEAQHPRNAKGEFIAFLMGAVEGARNGLTGTVEGLETLAAAGGSLVTDPQAWAKALETSKHVVEAAYDYGKAVADDPTKPFRDVRDHASSVYNTLDQGHSQAVAEGWEAKFWGRTAGRTAFELLDPIGKVGKITKATVLGVTAKATEATINAGRTAHGVEAAEHLASKTAADAGKAFYDAAAVERRAANIAASKEKLWLRNDLGDKWFKPDGTVDWPKNDGFSGPRVSEPLPPGAVVDRYSHLPGIKAIFWPLRALHTKLALCRMIGKRCCILATRSSRSCLPNRVRRHPRLIK